MGSKTDACVDWMKQRVSRLEGLSEQTDCVLNLWKV